MRATSTFRATMTSQPLVQHTYMADTEPPLPPLEEEGKYGGFTRFEIELEVCSQTLSRSRAQN